MNSTNRGPAVSHAGPEASSLANAYGQELSRVLCFMAENDQRNAFRVDVDVPTSAQARSAMEGNLDLLGGLTVRWHAASEQPLLLRVPLPYEGIFIARRQDSDLPLAMVWGAWLGEAPGFRLVRPTSRQRRGEIEWRIGMPRGYFVGAPLKPYEDLSLAVSARLRAQKARLLCDNTLYPEWLRPMLGNYGPRGSSNSPATRTGTAWKDIHNAICERCRDDDLSASDQDDLSHRILVTFPVWLKGRLCDELLRSIIVGLRDKNRNDLAADVVYALRSGESLDADRARNVWEHLLEQAETIATRLVPLRRTRLVTGEKADQAEGLHYVDPTNPVDMAARLTRVKRMGMRAGDMGEIPAEFRQNHPSFRGRLCPVESPESELVGLTLQLAQGATVDFDGRIHPGAIDQPINDLGYGAGMIPFFQHNDGARNMMGAKNLRQALPVVGRETPMVKSGGERTVAEFTRSLSDLGICPQACDKSGELAMGADLLVAYLPWHGMNFEDAMVVGEHLIKAGTMDVALTKRVRRRFKAGWEPRSPFRMAVFENMTNGLAREGDVLTAGSLIATLSCGGSIKPMEIRYNDRSPALLKHIRFERPREWMSGTLEYELEKHIPLGIGDKLMGRHGNKGVVGSILPAEKMPKLPHDSSIPEELRGRPIDILLNPHGVISRMNIGQLLETHIGWLLHSGVCTEGDLVRGSVPPINPIGYPFANNLDHDKVQALLKQSGLDETGRIQLVLPSGEKTLSPVVVGFQHIVRLRHIPELKAQARRGGVGALYSRKTGQAVHGRTRGGGQRIGEMEVWALAGHRAEYILEEMLGSKADSDWAKKLLTQESPPTGDLSNGFPAMFRDWLFALLIKAETADSQMKLSFASPDEVVDTVGENHRVESGWGMEKLVSAYFCCHAGKKDSPCGYVPVEGRIAVEPLRGKDKAIPSLQVDDLLRYLGLTAKGAMVRWGEAFKLPLQVVATHTDAGALAIVFEATGDKLKAVIYPAKGAERPTGWPEKPDMLFAEGRFSSSERGRNIPASDLLDEMLDPSGKHQLGDLRITCPRHKTVPLKASPPFGEAVRPVPGGLFDETVFGSPWAGSGSWSKRHWGYIELPVDVRLPVDAFLLPFDSWKKLSKEERQESASRFLKTLGLDEKNLPLVRRIPVLPVQYRQPIVMNDELVDDPLVERGYGPLLDLCGQYQKAVAGASATTAPDRKKKKRSPDEIIPFIESSVGNLFAMLAEHLRNKSGFIRTHGLGRRVDRSARLVIVPNPTLKWDQVGVPAAALFELLGDQVRAWLEKCGKSDDLLELVKVARAKQDGQPDLDHWSWWRSSKDEELILSAKKQLDEYLNAYPDTIVLLNRQPSLHRDSFQAFHPLALGPEAGDSLQLCPLVCKGFAADFDGDEMVVHLPVSKEAVAEARGLLPSQNLFSMASGEVLAHFDQDFVLGSYWINDKEIDLRKRLLDSLPGDCCRAIVPKVRSGKKAWQALMDHLASKHPGLAPDAIWRWMNLAFECCSRIGVSFGFYDLLDLRKRVNIGAEVFHAQSTGLELEGVNSTAQKLVKEVLGDILAEGSDWLRPGLHFAAMAMSGARGLKQTRQIVAARGFLNPGATGFDADLHAFAISSSLVDGMSPDEAFWAAMNARSSMCDKKLGTGHAGDLTRNLVFALWPFIVTCEDCGPCETPRSILTCKAPTGCCSACYGPLPDGCLPTVGFPAGLIAAQSIGERGTQLSMQSFHTGQRAFTIGAVRNILGHGDEEGYFDNLEGARRFVSAFKECDAYNSLQERHFNVLWRVIGVSPEHSLRSAIKNLGALSRIAFQSQAREIAGAALSEKSCPLSEPVARVLFDLFGKRSTLISGGGHGCS